MAASKTQYISVHNTLSSHVNGSSQKASMPYTDANEYSVDGNFGMVAHFHLQRSTTICPNMSPNQILGETSLMRVC